MEDVNQDSGSSWSSGYEDKPSSHISSAFTLQPAEGEFERNKEEIRQTMMEQEDIFRKQVFELHRVYKVQKDLMHDLKLSESLFYPVPIETSLSNLFSSGMIFEGAETQWQKSQIPVVSNFSEGGSVAGSGDTMPQQNFLPYSSFTENRSYLLGSGRSDNNAEAFTRTMFDLQRPAEVYMNSEETKRMQRVDVTEPSHEPENNVKLTLGLSEDSNENVNRNFFDLNEPVTDTCHEGSSGPTFTHSFGTRTHLKEVQGHQSPGNIGPWMDIVLNMHKNKETCPNVLSEETKKHWQLLNEAGPSQTATTLNSDLFSEKFPMSYEAIHAKMEDREVLLSDQYNTEAWLRGKQSYGLNNSGSKPSQFLLSPNMDIHTSAFPEFSSSSTPANEMRHNPLAVQAPPSLNRPIMDLDIGNPEAGIQNSGSFLGKQNYNADTSLKPAFGHESSSYQNGFPLSSFTLGNLIHSINSHESYGNSGGYASQKFMGLQSSGMNLNYLLQPENGIHDGYIAPRDSVLNNIDRNKNEASGNVSWLMMRNACSDTANLGRHASQVSLDSSQSYSGSFSNSHTVSSDILMRYEKGKSSSLQTLSAGQVKEINLNSKNINLNLNIPGSLKTSGRARKVPSIDLEAPISSQAEASILPRRKAAGKRVQSRKAENSQEKILKAAAENIISLSQNINFHLDPYSNPLHWFSEVVSSNAERATGFGSGSDNEVPDYFEALTLKLEETKMDEYKCPPKERKEEENRKNYDKDFASLLTKPRKGRAKKRRQRRDFQKDILPGLATLSRKEVTEDIQVIRELMQSAGITWNPGQAKRGAVRKPRKRGAAGARGRASPPPPPANVEQDKATGTSKTGRGGAAKRGRKQT